MNLREKHYQRKCDCFEAIDDSDVLKVVLLDKGLITLDDIHRAEQKLLDEIHKN